MKTRVFAVCVVVFLFCGITHAGLSDGLVAYYQFNGNVNDESGNGNLPNSGYVYSSKSSSTCFNSGEIHILNISPAKGTIIESNQNYTFTISLSYKYYSGTPKTIGVFAYELTTYKNLDDQQQNGINVTSESVAVRRT